MHAKAGRHVMHLAVLVYIQKGVWVWLDIGSGLTMGVNTQIAFTFDKCGILHLIEVLL